MFNLTKYLRLSYQILQKPGYILSSASHIQQTAAFASVRLCPQVKTIVTHEPSKLDPARIMLPTGPKKIIRKHAQRNLPRRRFKDGDRVCANEMLRVQRAAVQWKPGQYVIAGRNGTLNAQVSGTLKFTTEYDPDKVDLKRPFTDVLPDEAKLRTVVHVIPDEEHSRFKLVEQI